MAFYESIVSILNPIFNPLLLISPLFGVIIIAFLVSLVSKLIYWKTTDQHVMKQLKDDMKKLQAKLKDAKDNTEKMLEINSQLMKKNMEYFQASLKPMLISSLPVLLIFGWMSLHLAYDPILPNTDFTTKVTLAADAAGVVTLSAVPLDMSNANASLVNKTPATVEIDTQTHTANWTLSATEGEYLLTYTYGSANATQKVLITNERKYDAPMVTATSPFKKLEVLNHAKELIDLGFVKLNWFWTYLIFSIVFSLLIQKVLKIH